MTTIKIKSTDEASQGPFVVINKDDFNPEVHVLYEQGKQAKVAEPSPVDYSGFSKDELHAALKEKGIDFPSNANKPELIALLSK